MARFAPETKFDKQDRCPEYKLERSSKQGAHGNKLASPRGSDGFTPYYRHFPLRRGFVGDSRIVQFANQPAVDAGRVVSLEAP
ncbi:hypothetical protein ACFP9U_03630 [Nitratireductor sp. GCM10026969]